MRNRPFYDPNQTYEANYKDGPFGVFADGEKIVRRQSPTHKFLGFPVYVPFGIPAGPLLNSHFVAAAFAKGFDICVYKTVRTSAYPCHAWPNVLAVHAGRKLKVERKKPLRGDRQYHEPLSITNSFGVPSKDPGVWQEDMRRAVKAAGKGQVLVGSFQGTGNQRGNISRYIADFVLAARLVKQTGAKILEVNLSCPNEGTSHLLCFDVERTAKIAKAIKEEIGNTPLIIKIAYFADEAQLKKLVNEVGPVVDAIAAINTIPALITNARGQPALPGPGRERSGVCGSAIAWAGQDMVKRLVRLREALQYKFEIVGVGGVMRVADYAAYQALGADAVMSATGAMWHPYLARSIYKVNSKKGNL